MAKEIQVETPQNYSGVVHFSKIVLPSGTNIMGNGYVYIPKEPKEYIKTSDDL